MWSQFLPTVQGLFTDATINVFRTLGAFGPLRLHPHQDSFPLILRSQNIKEGGWRDGESQVAGKVQEGGHHHQQLWRQAAQGGQGGRGTLVLLPLLFTFPFFSTSSSRFSFFLFGFSLPLLDAIFLFMLDPIWSTVLFRVLCYTVYFSFDKSWPHFTCQTFTFLGV